MLHKQNPLHFNSDHLITRRDAFHFLALLPLEISGLSITPKPKYAQEEMLTQCAAGIMGCWYMIRGHKLFSDYIICSQDLHAAYSIVDTYIPYLEETIISSSSSHSNAAIDLLVQCLLLKASITRDIKGNIEGIAFMRLAEKYSRQSTNLTLHILVLRTLASVYAYSNHWKLALQTAKEAQMLLEREEKGNKGSIPYFVQSYLYSGLATYQGHLNQHQATLTSIGKAHETFDQSKKETKPIWVDHSEFNLILNKGVAQLNLGLYREALDNFEQTRNFLRGGIGSTEILINEVMAEVQREDKSRNMEWCIEKWTQGIEGAITLQSDQWFNEARSAYIAMRAIWPGETKIKNLRGLLTHW